jgi:hypothetical protein
MNNPEKLTAYGTQDEEKQSKKSTEYVKSIVITLNLSEICIY